ncbi:unnamed protein product, partial [Discosporangium mesarthrocarpum]
QVSLVAARIIVKWAKGTHNRISGLYGLPPRGTNGAVRDTDGGSGHAAGPDTGAGGMSHPPTALEETGAGGGGLPWAPLAPRVCQELRRLAGEGRRRPATALLGLVAALPFSGLAVFFGAQVLVGDAVLQWGASTPVGKSAVEGAGNALEVGKLLWLAGKLGGKQMLRLCQREFRRVGGVGGLACMAKEGVWYTTTHPVSAAKAGVGFVGEAGKAIWRQVGWVKDLVATVKEEL